MNTKAPCVLLWVAATLLCVPVASADWLQPGQGPNRLSVTADEGPTWPDVAFQVQLPTQGPSQWDQVDPVVVQGHAFVAGKKAAGLINDGAQPAQGFLFDVDLATAQWREVPLEPIVDDLAGQPQASTVKALASDGATLFVLQSNAVLSAFDAASLSPRWRTPLGVVEPFVPTGVGSCITGHVAALPDAVMVACTTDGGPTVWKVDSAAGDVDWSYSPIADPFGQVEGAGADVAEQDFNGIYTRVGDVRHVTGLSVIGGQAIVSVAKQNNAWLMLHPYEGPRRVANQAYYVAVAEDAAGMPQTAWVYAATAVWGQGDLTNPNAPLRESLPPAAVGSDGVVYLEGMGVFALRAGNTTQTRQFRPGHDGDPASGLALAPEGLYGTSVDTIHLVQAVSLAPVASWTLPVGQMWGTGSPVRTSNDLVIARLGPVQDEVPATKGAWTGLQALQAKTLEPVWHVTGFPGIVGCTFAVSDGLLLHWCANGILTVYGQYAGSPGAVPDASNFYPKPGETVTVDLGRSRPGAFGNVTQYGVSVGQDAVPEWQESPVFTHQFTDPQDVPVRYHVGNAANQTSSVVVIFHVGQVDPAVTIWNDPFGERYQNVSFFILGLLATAVIALLGIARAGRKRRRFHRELKALEDDYRRLESDSRACDAMLNARKSGARALFLQKKLEEAHASFLERRVDELRRGLRLGAIEEKLKFLPYGMVAQLQRLLVDGRVDQWERDHFVDALALQKDLSAAQKATARRVIEEWFARDAT